MYIYNFFRNTL